MTDAQATVTLDEFLASLEGGTVHSSGAFTISEQAARDKLARANAAVATDDNARALTLAQQAQVDARLAEVKARAIKAQKAAAELGEGNRVLREEMERKAK